MFLGESLCDATCIYILNHWFLGTPMTMETSIYSLVLMMGSSVILLADFVVAAAGLLTVKLRVSADQILTLGVSHDCKYWTEKHSKKPSLVIDYGHVGELHLSHWMFGGITRKSLQTSLSFFSTHLEELNGIYLKITTNIHLVILTWSWRNSYKTHRFSSSLICALDTTFVANRLLAWAWKT